MKKITINKEVKDIHGEIKRELIDEIYSQGNRVGYHDPRLVAGYVERLYYEQHKDDNVMVVGENCRHGVLNVSGDCPYCKKHLCDHLSHNVERISCTTHGVTT